MLWYSFEDKFESCGFDRTGSFCSSWSFVGKPPLTTGSTATGAGGGDDEVGERAVARFLSGGSPRNLVECLLFSLMACCAQRRTEIALL